MILYTSKTELNMILNIYDKKFPFFSIRWLIFYILVFCLFLCLYSLYFSSLIYLSENQVLYIYSSIPQIIAGIYGLTITGFVFFIDFLQRKTEYDETLENIIETLSRTYFRILKAISFLSLVTIILSVISIFLMDSKYTFLFKLFMNLAPILFFTTIAFIFYFAILVINPEQFSSKNKALFDKIKTELNLCDQSNSEIGNFSEFIRNFNKMENHLRKVYSSRLVVDRARVSYRSLVEGIYRLELIDYSTYKEILDLIKIRNLTVHSERPEITVAVEKKMASMLGKIEKIDTEKKDYKAI